MEGAALRQSVTAGGLGTSAYELASKNGHIHIVRCLVENQYPGLDGVRDTRENVLCALVRQNSLADARWLLHQPPYKGFQLTPSVLAAAAASTTPDTRAKLEWLLDEEGCPAGPKAAAAAARRGDLDTLQWLAQRGCRAPPDLLLEAAAEGGTLQLLESLLDVEAFDLPAYRRACKAAAASGELPAVRLLLSRETPAMMGQDAQQSLLSECVLAAVAGKQLEALQLLWDESGARLPEGDGLHGLPPPWYSPWDPSQQPAPHVRILQWLWQRTGGRLGEGVAKSMFQQAALQCCLPVMAFLYDELGEQLLERREQLLAGALETAVASCSEETLPALDWLHAHGCRLAAVSEGLWTRLVTRERLELLEWLHAHGHRLELSRGQFLLVLAQGSLELVEWFHERGLLPPQVLSGDGGDGGMLRVAVRSGSVPLVKWLVGRGCALQLAESSICRQAAVDAGSLEMLNYMWWLTLWRPLSAVVLAICLAVAFWMHWGGQLPVHYLQIGLGAAWVLSHALLRRGVVR